MSLRIQATIMTALWRSGAMPRQPLEWDPRAFCGRLGAVLDPAAVEAASVYAGSIGRKINFAHFHGSEHLAVLKQALPENTATALAIMMGARSACGTEPDEASREAFLEARWRSEAHLVAFIQVLHTVPDSIAQLLHVVGLLNRNGEAPRPHRLYLKKARNILAEGSATRCEANQLLDSPEFEVLNALANTIKHYLIVDSAFHVSFREEQRRGLRMTQFAYDGRSYEARWAQDFLNTSWDVLVPIFIQILRAIECDLGLPDPG